jgi:hypothetical protein
MGMEHDCHIVRLSLIAVTRGDEHGYLDDALGS